MTETGDLKGRVETAIQQLATSHEQRREHNQSLTRLLANLETKYGARNEELRHCHARIRALSAANEQLIGLVERLVGMVETHVKSDPDEGVRRASAMAQDMLRGWPEDFAAEDVAERENPPVMRFEDVSDAELAAELAVEEPMQEPDPVAAEPAAEIIDASTAGDMPAFEEFEVVDQTPADDIEFEPAADSTSRQSHGPSLNGSSESVEIDIPEPESPPGQRVRQERETTRDDIRAMLDRLERAAARAQSFVDQETGKNGKTASARRERSA